jgi:hypothetical protein
VLVEHAPSLSRANEILLARGISTELRVEAPRAATRPGER